MEVTARSKAVRISPRKIREVASAAKKLSVNDALAKLPFSTKNGAREILKALESAVANAKQETSKLTIKNILVDEGLKMKRRDKSHGARYGGGVIQKRTSNITVILEG